ncbi:hypothetical protein OO006_07160 [Prosthecochloris sp. SCSIO W1101]|uniref:hypothetical protein n=1 Tax=Prosthecochloris sp. SCSIO W1101 TaxID=2992242 RepID=UPI00223CE43C|nr:hypothetical protein [Prosthecochloris sp. SCSIO W1101]UZJ40156.1 hypothetical protein OO006_07160 [Prosthecochloris sp. SCSIO W1101]
MKRWRQVGERFGKRPGVIVGQGKRGFWSTHGSSAWFVRLLHDAGANYILEESTDYEENPISFEHAMKIGLVADYWINPLYTATSIADIINSDSRYTHFFPSKRVTFTTTMPQPSTAAGICSGKSA